MKAWHAPGPNGPSLAEIDLRVGGSYRIHMRGLNGGEHQAFGVYTEVDPPKKVAYTWNWVEMPNMGETLVTIDFVERGDSTEVVLRHSGLPSAAGEKHTEGWNAILDKLCEHFGSPTSGEVHQACTD